MRVSVSDLQLNEKYYLEPAKGINTERVVGVFKGDELDGLAITFKVKPSPGIALYKGGIIFPKNTKTMFEKVASN